MKIAIIGTGKMGTAIEKMAIENGHTVILKINETNRELLQPDSLKQVDVAIEFTQPEAAIDNLYACLDAGIPVVCGTTGWQSRLSEVTERFQSEKGSLIYASNFSVGVNLLFELNRILSGWMNRQPDYKAEIIENHHTAKLDKPSGTALTLADDLMKFSMKYTEWSLTENKNHSAEKLAIESIREDDVIGIHTINWTSSIDKISLHHEAFSRSGFAAGALQAASWIIGRKGIFTMKDVLFPPDSATNP
ncbi:4-hydroxy-tetrahydrodipicolinate reductase [soil metagenome]